MALALRAKDVGCAEMTPRHRIRPVVIRDEEPPWYLQLAAAAGIGMLFAIVLAEWAMQ